VLEVLQRANFSTALLIIGFSSLPGYPLYSLSVPLALTYSHPYTFKLPSSQAVIPLALPPNLPHSIWCLHKPLGQGQSPCTCLYLVHEVAASWRVPYFPQAFSVFFTITPSASASIHAHGLHRTLGGLSMKSALHKHSLNFTESCLPHNHGLHFHLHCVPPLPSCIQAPLKGPSSTQSSYFLPGFKLSQSWDLAYKLFYLWYQIIVLPTLNVLESH
jgi:hypothetical protein